MCVMLCLIVGDILIEELVDILSVGHNPIVPGLGMRGILWASTGLPQCDPSVELHGPDYAR
jgi:hypothetical protein